MGILLSRKATPETSDPLVTTTAPSPAPNSQMSARAHRRPTSPALLVGAMLVACSCTDPLGSSDRGAAPRVVWRAPLDFGEVGWSGVPAVGGGRVYVATGPGLAALDQATGRVVWAQRYGPAGGTPAAANLVAHGDQVFVPAEGGAYAVDAASGALRWTHVGDSLTARAALSADADAVYAGTRDRRLLALDAADGRTRWAADVGRGWRYGGLTLGSAVAGDTVYAAAVRYLTANTYGRAGVVVALDRRTGAELWRYQSDTTQRRGVDAVPVVAGGLLVAVDPEGHAFFALDRGTGREVWRVPTARDWAGPSGAPVVVGDTVFVGSNDRLVYAADLATGRVLWSTRAGVSVDHIGACGPSILAVNQGVTFVDRARRRAAQTVLTGREDFATSGVATAGGRAFITSIRAANAFDCNG